MPLAPGVRLGPYEILSPLGTGGMGEVYRARDEQLHRDVEIKVLPERTTGRDEAVGRFEREARAVATLSHPNIVAVHSFSSEGGIRYLVMELLEGETLQQRLRRGPLPAAVAAETAAQVADALAAAHERGVVHRDGRHVVFRLAGSPAGEHRHDRERSLASRNADARRWRWDGLPIFIVIASMGT